MTRYLPTAAGMICLLAFAACSDEETGTGQTDELPGPIVGEWVFQKSETYCGGRLIDSFTAVEAIDKCIAIFREDGTFRYYDYPPEEFYEGTYTYDESAEILSTHSDEIDYVDTSDPQVCRAEVTMHRMKWTYPEEVGEVYVEYYLRR